MNDERRAASDKRLPRELSRLRFTCGAACALTTAAVAAAAAAIDRRRRRWWWSRSRNPDPVFDMSSRSSRSLGHTSRCLPEEVEVSNTPVDVFQKQQKPGTPQ
ncbi:unnamed protein product [Lampetra fluviatilis]